MSLTNEETSMDVLGIGCLVLDTIGSVKEFPAPDHKTRVYDLTNDAGGPAATAMVTCRRLGLRSALIARVGDDREGEELRQKMEQEGVDISRVIVGKKHCTMRGFCFAQVGTGRRVIYYHRSRLPVLHIDEIDKAALRKTSVLLIDGLELHAGAQAAEIVRGAGGVTVIDAGTARAGMEEALPKIDYLVASASFARDYTKCDRLEEALEKLRWTGYHRAVVITLGEEGYIAAEGGLEPFRGEAFAVRAVDTTGAGDVFHGAFCAGLIHKWPFPKICRFAAACAAMKCARLGGQKAIPTWDEAIAFCRDQDQQFQWP